MRDPTPGFYLETDYLPIVLMRQVGHPDEQFDVLLTQLGELIAREMPLLLVWDARGCDPATPIQRAAAANLIKRHWSAARQHCIATVFVVDSQLLRGAVTATMWLVKPPFRVEMVTTREEVEACLRGYAAQEKVDLGLVERFLGQAW